MLALLPLLANLATPAHGAGHAANPGEQPSSLQALSHNRPTPCPGNTAAAPPGWQAEPAQCVWQGRLAMQRWELAAPDRAGNCLSPQALWWQWRLASMPSAPAGPLWDRAWQERSLAGPGAADSLTLSWIGQDQQGRWRAAVWQWRPPARSATRAWEQQRWQEWQQALTARAAPLTAPANPTLYSLWQRNLQGRAGERDGDTLLWQSGQYCLRLRAAPAAPEIPLPYAREDSRLEQRAAIQVQLARSAPDLSWPSPFHLLPPSLPQQRSAAYAAIASAPQRLSARLWLPASHGPGLRLAIDALPDGPPGSPAEARLCAVLEHELATLAARWSAEHER